MNGGKVSLPQSFIFTFMPSLIPGYAYDIFISYRQKDNKYDGWVAEFVANLRKELEATFKEDISIYFDENPHDGLLETHQVDKSLEGKLKCLLFVPIISQTYCDPKSFAWQHELCVFNRMTKEDQFGKDIRLASGNVSSRILPIRIHDLETEDKAILETELGGNLRAIEFIFKSAGVNRPLRASEDHPQDNLNKIFYRDQINKVSHAVKEIIGGMRKKVGSVGGQGTPQQEVTVKSRTTSRVAWAAATLLILSLFLFFLVPSIRSLRPGSEPLNKSIAVIPFKNFSTSDETQYFADGVMEEILNHLSKIKDLKVISRTSMEPYRKTLKSTGEIAKEVGVNHLLEGSVQRDGNKVRVTVQLINALNDDHVWSGNYDKELKDIFAIQSSMAQNIANQLEISLGSSERNSIHSAPAYNLDAYDNYLKGKDKLFNFRLQRKDIDYIEGIRFLNLALAQDSSLAPAYAEYAWAYGYRNYFKDYLKDTFMDSVLLLANKALALDPNLSAGYALRGIYYANVHSSFDQAEVEFKRSIELDPNRAINYIDYGESFSVKPEIAFENYLKGLQLDPNSSVKAELYRDISWAYLGAGVFDRAEQYAHKAVENNPDVSKMFVPLVHAYLMQGKFGEALAQCLEWRKISPGALRYLQEIYTFQGKYGMAEQCLIEYEHYFPLDQNYKQRFGVVLWKLGEKKEAMDKFGETMKEYELTEKLKRPETIGNYYDMAGVNAFIGNKEEA